MQYNNVKIVAAIFVGFFFGITAAAVLFYWLPFETTSNSSFGAFQKPLEPLPTDSYSASVDIVAVLREGQAGVTNKAVVEIREGKGRVLFALNPFTEPDTQQSAETAAQVAQKVTGKDLSGFDLIYSIESDAALVGGPSAGAALAVATIAAIEKKEVNQQTVITGTIEPDGKIGGVGGIIEKAAAASKAGKKTFLVPTGQSILSYYEPVETVQKQGFFEIRRIEYVPKQLDLKKYAKEELNLEIAEVSTIEGAMKYFF